MVLTYDNVRRDVLDFLFSLRHSMDRGNVVLLKNDIRRTDHIERLLAVERARIRVQTYVRARQPTQSEWLDALAELSDFVDDFMQAKYMSEALSWRFHVTRPNRSGPTALFESLSRTTIAQALIEFQYYLKQTAPSYGPQAELRFEDIADLVPFQQLAPAHFTVADDRIVLLKRDPFVTTEDGKNIESALDYITGAGVGLIQSLEQSNCDRRLVEGVKELHKQILTNDNVVKIGLANMACGMMAEKYEGELPDAINAMINSYNASVSMYVAQFPEWQQFSHKAATIELYDDDLAQLDAAAASIIKALEGRPDLAEPEVPKTISLVREFMRHPGASAKRAAFAMLRTIENLISSIVRYSLKTLEDTAVRTSEHISKAGATVIVGLLGVALLSATQIGDTALNAGSPWIKQVTDVVRKQIDDLAAR